MPDGWRGLFRNELLASSLEVAAHEKRQEKGHGVLEWRKRFRPGRKRDACTRCLHPERSNDICVQSRFAPWEYSLSSGCRVGGAKECAPFPQLTALEPERIQLREIWPAGQPRDSSHVSSRIVRSELAKFLSNNNQSVRPCSRRKQ